MSIRSERALADLTGTGQNAAVNVEDLESGSVWVHGTFVGTAQVQVSPRLASPSWVNEGSALTVPGRIAIPAGTALVRIDCTAFTSGDIESTAAGRDDDRKG